MNLSKKPQILWTHGIFDFLFGILILVYSIILMQNFVYAFLYIFTLTTFSSLNAVNIAKKISPFSFSTSLISLDEKTNQTSSKKTDRKEFSLFKCLCIVILSICFYYLFAVFFGAPLLESWSSTLYFSCLMTLLSVYPLLWYFYFTDSIVATLKILLDTKFHTATESHLYTFTVWTVVGAWFGAFPIPLDWDRPWQEWPITCCVGAASGFAAAHCYVGFRLLHGFFRDSKKVSGSRQV